MLDYLQKELLPKLGFALMFAGILRIISSFQSDWGILSQKDLYGIIDISLFLGTVGFYFKMRPSFLSLGFLGSMLSLLSTAILASRLWIDYQTNPYFISAGALLIGYILMTASAWRWKRIFFLPFLFFLVSMILGAIGNFVSAVRFFYLLSGVSFGIGAFLTGHFSQYQISFLYKKV
ncbi:hypothetical protein EHO59_13680 [Leptospira semungkisensis]|uniref:Uncharacterized protein n=1 Tax=Leptospira semungkisensis TaxID=2484985 RepID=A0A4R9FRF2_9LEPT|nr:hypothetical protein [Leptospira semungkisensis]TGK00965.1 hypothetical protein EHO59_13680 [Leptospira semungkisensis]